MFLRFALKSFRRMEMTMNCKQKNKLIFAYNSITPATCHVTKQVCKLWMKKNSCCSSSEFVRTIFFHIELVLLKLNTLLQTLTIATRIIGPLSSLSYISEKNNNRRFYHGPFMNFHRFLWPPWMCWCTFCVFGGFVSSFSTTDCRTNITSAKIKISSTFNNVYTYDCRTVWFT